MVVVGSISFSSSLLSSFNQHPLPALTATTFATYSTTTTTTTRTTGLRIVVGGRGRRSCSNYVVVRASAADHSPIGDAAAASSNNKKKVPSSNYVVPFDSSSCMTRPLAEILRDLNKRIPDNIIINKPPSPIDPNHHHKTTYIPWYHANRMLSFYAPGWCGEIRDVIFSDNGSVTVVYRVTIRGSDGEAHRESTGTVSPPVNGHVDAVAAAEEIAFCRACARFGLGLYLYHDE